MSCVTAQVVHLQCFKISNDRFLLLHAISQFVNTLTTAAVAINLAVEMLNMKLQWTNMKSLSSHFAFHDHIRQNG
jgi:hypothetical protein